MKPLRGAGSRYEPVYLREKNSSRDRWMISYTDVVTILLILFMAVAARSLQDHKARSNQSAVSSTPPKVQSEPASGPAAKRSAPNEAQPPSPSGEPSEALVKARDRLQKSSVYLRMEARGLVIVLPQEVLFASGDDRINPAALPMIGEIADVLRDLPNKVLLVGHADAVPIHNRHFRNNWELSAARGVQLLEVLTRRYGIPEARLAVASYGSYSPKSPNDTPAERAANRRVEVVVLSDSAASGA